MTFILINLIIKNNIYFEEKVNIVIFNFRKILYIKFIRNLYYKT